MAGAFCLILAHVPAHGTLCAFIRILPESHAIDPGQETILVPMTWFGINSLR
jgi:hypothetical protein